MARPQRQRPAGRQLPSLRPNPEPLAVGSAELPDSGSTASGSTEVPKYQQMQRRDARLRPEQWRALDALRDRVAASRTDRRERITDNTLLRIAADLLLTRADELRGDTEAGMRASLGLSEYRSPEPPDSGGGWW